MDNQPNQNSQQDTAQQMPNLQDQTQQPTQRPISGSQGVQSEQATPPIQEPLQNASVTNTPKMKIPKMPHLKIPRKAVIGAIVLVVIFIVLMVLLVVAQNFMNANNGTTGPISENSPTPTPTTTLGSPYADDPDILDIKNKVEEFESSLNSTRIREDTLRIPVLEWDVNFEN